MTVTTATKGRFKTYSSDETGDTALNEIVDEVSGDGVLLEKVRFIDATLAVAEVN